MFPEDEVEACGWISLAWADQPRRTKIFIQFCPINVVNTMKKIIIILAAWAVLTFLPPLALAKRIPAPTVEPVIHDGIQYIAPNDNGRREYIQALDAKTGKLLKEITVKRNFIWFWIEEDLQWFYVTKMEVQGNYLFVTDEKNRVFKVKLLKKKSER
jgi:hypothetical protein